MENNHNIPGKGAATTSLVLGIIAVICCLIPVQLFEAAVELLLFYLLARAAFFYISLNTTRMMP